MNYRPMPDKDELPYALYRAEQVREFDRLTIEHYSIPGLELMERAGQEVFQLLCREWPGAKQLVVVAGGGNNAGDGYVVARLAQEAGLIVTVVALVDPLDLAGDARANADRWMQCDGRIIDQLEEIAQSDVIIDAILGTGLGRPVTGEWASCIEAINQSGKPVLAVDIPSGLNADTGAIQGIAINASHTMSFIALKQGMFTGDALACCGRIHHRSLAVPARVFASTILSARRIDWVRMREQLHPRSPVAHKGQCGHVLIVAGDKGMVGAAILATSAAARTGAGLVSLVTYPGLAAEVLRERPEVMVHEVGEGDDIQEILARADVIAVGPGLGQREWGKAMWSQVCVSKLPLVVDADALNCLSLSPQRRDNWVLTPHPGEAARLLACATKDIQQDRLMAAADLVQRYGGVALLKGAGTVIDNDEQGPPAICSDGNSGMASGGMGDLLTGIIASLIAQGHDLRSAAEIGVCMHAHAADIVAEENGARGMLASDLLPEIQRLTNRL
ncbi:MAG: NAD(P)H-hydrate dehydratase [bacterium]